MWQEHTDTINKLICRIGREPNTEFKLASNGSILSKDSSAYNALYGKLPASMVIVYWSRPKPITWVAKEMYFLEIEGSSLQIGKDLLLVRDDPPSSEAQTLDAFSKMKMLPSEVKTHLRVLTYIKEE